MDALGRYSLEFRDDENSSAASPRLYTLHLTLQLRCLSPLVFHRIVRFDGFGLDDDSRVASGEGAAFGGDGSGDIAGR